MIGSDVRPLTSPPIGEALTLDALDRFDRALGIRYAERDAGVASEIELAEVAF